VTDESGETRLPADDPIAALTHQITHLERAIASRDVIGQAKGILMERHHIGPDEAFEQLRFASQQQNRKLAALAEDLAATGQWPPESTA
jgi:AmiR/NasT family two-component response regulator